MSESRFAILDPVAGISGDMVLGALLAAGAEEEWLRALPARLGCPRGRSGDRPRRSRRARLSQGQRSTSWRSHSNTPPSRTATRTTITTTANPIRSTRATTVPTGMWEN